MTKFDVTADMQEAFSRDGYLHIQNFYDLETEVNPIRRHICELVLLLNERHFAKEHSAKESYPRYVPDDFDSAFLTLIAKDRRFGSVIYDAIKQSPHFLRLACSAKHDGVMHALRPGSSAGVCGNGYGVRMDIPGEDKYKAMWHQEFPTQLRSQDGLIFWTPLVAMTTEIGPVKLCKGSHRAGPIAVEMSENDERQGAYAVRLQNEPDVIGQYEISQPIAKPGDVLIIDWMTIHASGTNRSERVRWSMQSRYFNFNDPVGKELEWQGSFSGGANIEKYLNQFIKDKS